VISPGPVDEAAHDVAAGRCFAERFLEMPRPIGLSGLDAGGGMDQEAELTLKIRMDRKKYAWTLYRSGISEPIKYSVPIFSTEAAATAAGLEVLARVNTRKKKVDRSGSRGSLA
jgi:hypothetical protein